MIFLFHLFFFTYTYVRRKWRQVIPAGFRVALCLAARRIKDASTHATESAGCVVEREGAALLVESEVWKYVAFRAHRGEWSGYQSLNARIGRERICPQMSLVVVTWYPVTDTHETEYHIKHTSLFRDSSISVGKWDGVNPLPLWETTASPLF